MAAVTNTTPEQILLSAILATMSPKKRAKVLAIVGESAGDNVVRLRAPAASQLQRDTQALTERCIEVAETFAFVTGAR